MNDGGQEDNLHVCKPDKQDRSFDVLRVNYIYLDSVGFVMFIKLESSMIQRKTHIVYKIDTGVDDNLMLFKLFKNLIPKLTLEQLHPTKAMLWFKKHTIVQT